MPSLADTIHRLSYLKRLNASAPASGTNRLTELALFGSNPGALLAKSYVPDNLPRHPALVVVLHGCTQTAAGYDLGSGWSELADRYGFVLLFPEQQRQNNPNLCFNWFVPEDSQRASGEALSIRQMVATMIDNHDIDPARVYVTGLSAGGAMTSVMLATYPEVFAGGAIIAGLPYGCANTIPQAFDRMRGHGGPSGEASAALVRNASGHAGRWPTISVWHGSADATVNATNADAIVDQWRALHGVAVPPDRTDAVDGYPRRVWCDGSGREVIEEYSITGMGHGTPLDTLADNGCGKSGAYMLEASISSTQRICRFWGLASDEMTAARHETEVFSSARSLQAAPSPSLTEVGSGTAEPPASVNGVGKVIEDALRAVGLMR